MTSTVTLNTGATSHEVAAQDVILKAGRNRKSARGNLAAIKLAAAIAPGKARAELCHELQKSGSPSRETLKLAKKGFQAARRARNKLRGKIAHLKLQTKTTIAGLPA